ncbi:hypothetical protein PoMZ_08431 [Pyricularia oryzae]|uniref:Uncharacterized protein n=1 Tax=Pyricularia oryzae TaxID=318829 RepID=A0A4P7NHL3_PYROR|nr:hypothetical protein PoMZ_08431 [Pyricularia oryzae]
MLSYGIGQNLVLSRNFNIMRFCLCRLFNIHEKLLELLDGFQQYCRTVFQFVVRSNGEQGGVANAKVARAKRKVAPFEDFIPVDTVQRHSTGLPKALSGVRIPVDVYCEFDLVQPHFIYACRFGADYSNTDSLLD